MTTYTAITGAEIDTDSPITESLMTRLRDNPIAIMEKASGAPVLANNYVTNTMVATNAITDTKIATGAVTSSKIGTAQVTESKFHAAVKPWIILASGTSTGGTNMILDGSSSYSEFQLVIYNYSRLGSGLTLFAINRNGGADVGIQFTITSGSPITGTTDPSEFRMTLFNPAGGHKKKWSINGYDGTTAVLAYINTGVNTAYTGAVSGIRLYTTGNGPFSGTFILYGR